MKRVWKCDFCNYTNILLTDIKYHEKNCDYNPIFKSCWSCKNNSMMHNSGFCEIGVLSFWHFQKFGNCDNWETNDKKLIRKLKLEQLKNIKDV